MQQQDNQLKVQQKIIEKQDNKNCFQIIESLKIVELIYFITKNVIKSLKNGEKLQNHIEW